MSEPIEIGKGSIERLPELLRPFENHRIFLVAEKKAFGLHGKTVESILTQAGYEFIFIPFTGGEENKTLASAESIFHELLAGGANRKTPIIAMGGGVTTDLVGFIASTFMRGVPLFLIPTTLLAQVDAAIGGKNGINLAEGKNLIGTFYFPETTIIDPAFLRTLPPREFRCGFAEIIKMAILEGEEFFSGLESLPIQDLSIDLDPYIKRAVQGKIEIVKRDPKETKGERAKLNLGHTFAHALEAATGYKHYTHGEAVSIGLMASCRLAEEAAGLSSNVTARVKKVLENCRLPVKYDQSSPKMILDAMSVDKKKVDSLRFILPTKLGHVITKEKIPDETILKILEELRCVGDRF